MKIIELRGKTLDQLRSLLLDLKKESLNLRFQKVAAELTNLSRIRQVRKDIARLKTVLNELSVKAKKGGKDA